MIKVFDREGNVTSYYTSAKEASKNLPISIRTVYRGLSGKVFVGKKRYMLTYSSMVTCCGIAILL